MKKNILFRGQSVEIDCLVECGKKFPNIRLVKRNLEDFLLEDNIGKVIIINSFPSIDTGVCALQTINFNNKEKELQDVLILTVSKDLPFALDRFCGDKNIDNAITLSDYKYRDFEDKIGSYISEVGLLARQVIVLDKEGIVRHIDICENVSEEPDYEKVLKVVEELI